MNTSIDKRRSLDDTMGSRNQRSKTGRDVSQKSVAIYPSTLPSNFDNRTVSTKSELSISSVRFASTVTVRLIRTRHEYTPKQKKRCFYQGHEFQEIKKQCYEDLQRYMLVEDGDESKREEKGACCLRGLENFDDWASRQKHRIRDEAAFKVFDVQDLGCNDVTISREYYSVTARSQMWANIMGLRDQRDAVSIYAQSTR
uniref:Uncharacterized protein n=1 Tax=Pseudo-nitzschia delicatissima TaxID=44447 RepID=A0A7S0XKY1_9STRA|mmetsp:Transcript_1594/g.3724  ORF Transcript_1594/g.3724 Transcript_1594/m.3724 type:complete len:199 (+) Transcript_1594:57-653(+)